jgi:hypothetical protein
MDRLDRELEIHDMVDRAIRACLEGRITTGRLSVIVGLANDLNGNLRDRPITQLESLMPGEPDGDDALDREQQRRTEDDEHV